MSYQPQTRPKHGFQPLARPAMSVICDVCNRPRTKGNHHACSEARRAAGFVYAGERS